MRTTFRTLGVLATAATITALSLTLTAGPATAQPSNCRAPQIVNRDHGYGVMKGTFNLKAGPYAGTACPTVGKAGKGRVLYFLCWTVNRWGNMWVYGRVKGASTHGWMSVDNFASIHKSNFATCPKD